MPVVDNIGLSYRPDTICKHVVVILVKQCKFFFHTTFIISRSPRCKLINALPNSIRELSNSIRMPVN